MERFKKGDIVGIKGRIQTSIYETEDGSKRKATEENCIKPELL